MTREGLAYDEALAQAQELGYAEADPTLDVDGTDTAHKLAILAQLAFGASVRRPRIPRDRGSTGSSSPTSSMPASWATPSSCWRWPGSPTRAWSSAWRRRW